MTFEKVRSKIEEISAEIISIQENDFDDIKDVELQEGIIRQLIFEYCMSQRYEVNGFPFVHLKKVEAGEPGYDEDYLTWERMDYYIQRLALEKEDVFELCRVDYQRYFSGLDPREVRGLINDVVAMAEKENLQLTFPKKRSQNPRR